jgi:hypothetical protein
MNLKGKALWVFALGLLAILLAPGGAVQADEITLFSSTTTTLGASLGTIGVAPDTTLTAQLQNGPIPDLSSFTSVTQEDSVSDISGTDTPVPPSAPSGTEVIDLPGAEVENGYSGFFLVTFTLPTGFSNVTLSGVGNVDDQGSVFLNGNLISSSLTEFGDAAFSTDIQSDFTAGTNYLVIADDNSGGGPSGASFYADVSYTVPEPASLLLIGISLFGLASFRKKFRAA